MKKNILLFFFLFFLASQAHAMESIFSDNFNDQNILDWDVNSGSWDANAQFLRGGTTDPSSISHTITMPIGRDYNMLYLNDNNTANLNNFFMWFTDQNGIIGGNVNGYQLLIQTTTTRLRRVANGTATNLFTSSGKAAGIDHNVNIFHDSNGLIRVWIDGNFEGGATDTTYTSGSRIIFGTENGASSAKFDNLNILIDSNISGSVDYNNFVNYSGVDYVKDLNITVNYQCDVNRSGIALRLINSTNDKNYNLTCDNVDRDIYDIYRHNAQGDYNIAFYLRDLTFSKTISINNRIFRSDLNAPSADINFSTSGGGFFSGTPNITAYQTCIDTISPVIDYNMLNNWDINVFSGRRDANTTVSVTLDVNTGSNLFKARCTDLVGNNTTDTNTINIFSNCYNLVDESTGASLTTSDINSFFTSLTARGYETNSTFNFKSPLAVSTCYRSIGDDTVRFDLNYSDGTNIYREFNLTILQDINTTVPVCVADPQDLFEQLFTASQQREVVLYSILGNCYNLADYTKYALQDSLSHRAFTISLPYRLNTDQNNQSVILALINGAVESTINLDVLVFRNETFETGLQPDELTISLYVVPPLTDSNTVQIYYNNLAANNVVSAVTIFDGNNAQLYSQTITTTPNTFTLYFDTTTIDVNGEVLKIQVLKTFSDGTSETITRYFTLSGSSSSFPTGLGIIFAFVITFFGLTLVRWSQALGWFGLITIMAGTAILAFTPGSASVLFLQAVLLIAGAYIYLVFKDDTVRT